MFLQRKMMKVRLERIVGNDIIYRLPSANVSKFSRLFRALEKKLNKLNLARFGVSAPTMDETFLKIAADKFHQLNVVDFESSNSNGKYTILLYIHIYYITYNISDRRMDEGYAGG